MNMQPALLTLLTVVILYALYRNFGIQLFTTTRSVGRDVDAEARRKSDAIIAKADQRQNSRASHLRLVK